MARQELIAGRGRSCCRGILPPKPAKIVRTKTEIDGDLPVDRAIQRWICRFATIAASG